MTRYLLTNGSLCVSLNAILVKGVTIMEMIITQTEKSELVELYHVAKVAGHTSRYDRLCYAVNNFMREHNLDSNGCRIYVIADNATRI